MMSSFQVVSIGDVCSVGDGAHSKVQRVDEGIPYLTSKNIGQGSLKLDKLDFITEESFEKLFPANSRATRRPTPGDVLFGIIGTFGNAYLYTENDNFGFSSSIGVLRPNPEVLDSEYLYYVVSSKVFKSNHANHNAGSVQGYTNIPTVKSLSIPLPPLSEQTRIVKSLKSLDNKIQLNRQTNQTLEQIAQAMFKSWFVDFEPTRAKIAAKQTGQNPERAAMAAISGKALDQLDSLPADTQQQLKTTAALFPDALVDSELGEIPEGWRVSELGDMLDFNPKRTLKKGVMAPYLDMKNVPTQGHLAAEVYLREMASGTKFINGDTLLARITPCLENGKTAYVDFLEEDQVAWGSTEYIVMRPKNGRPMSLGYIIARLDSFRSKAIQTMTGTSGRQRANSKALSEQAWIDYPLELLHSFDLIAGAYLNKAKQNGDENKTLEGIRDSLLPKLLSGQFSIG